MLLKETCNSTVHSEKELLTVVRADPKWAFGGTYGILDLKSNYFDIVKVFIL